MSVKTITVRTAADGSYTYARSFQGMIHAIAVDLGDAPNALSTPDVTITDATFSKSILDVDGVAADTVYYPSSFLQSAAGSDAALVGTGMKGATGAICMGVLTVAVTGAGDTKRGKITIFYT